MTIEERLERNRQASQAVMKYALPLGLWFIAEYVALIASAHNLTFSMLRVPMMGATILILFYLVFKIRKNIFKEYFHVRQGWFYTMQLMFYAGLIEAIFIFVINKWILPGNLAEMQAALLAQYEEVNNALQASGSMPALTSLYTETMETLRQSPVETPINTAIGQLSNDVIMGMLLGIPIGFILKRKEKQEEVKTRNKKQDNIE